MEESENRIPVAKTVIGELEKVNVLDCSESSWISSAGRYIGEFEKQFADENVEIEEIGALQRRVAALESALLRMRRRHGHLDARRIDGLKKEDEFYSDAIVRVRQALSESQFYSIRAVTRLGDDFRGRKYIKIESDRITTSSIVHVTCSEAVGPANSTDASAFIAMPGDARVEIFSVICGDGVIFIDTEVHWSSPLCVMINVTLLGTPQQVIFSNVGDEGEVSDAARAGAQPVRKSLGFDELGEGDDVEFIELVYRRLLGRAVDETGLNHFTHYLNGEKTRRASVIAEIRASDEYKSKYP